LSRSASKKRTSKKLDRKKTPNWFFIVGGIAILLIIIAAILILDRQPVQPPSTATTNTLTSSSHKPIILYVNQGNALVDESNYSVLVSYAKSHHFNTIFFQIYKSGQLLFNQSELSFFVNSAHLSNLSVFFALYFTTSLQSIPTSIYGLGENGINLDMSTLTSSAQKNLLSTLQQNYKNGLIAVTTLNFTTTLRPNYLILETYSHSDQSYIHRGIIASVEPLAISNSQSYNTQFQYALNNSDGVMVFDYYGLLKTGY
jgi:hypothetical protein